ncbi:MAG TPA: UDP-N-acetylmuramyl-tripeptide synthetase [Patescibacteria group bacterium]|nr:UDP-N-acetylmuramyl-tripeptide synthetase [Patescibacteria group bacterium]
MKEFLKKIIPTKLLKSLRPPYHGALALLANTYYGKPSSKLIVIGVTGTAGKSTTVQLLAHILRGSGKKTGFTTTISSHDGDVETLNRENQSMPGGPVLHKQIKAMLAHGCEFAIIECTSEGLEQNRHLGIQFDAAILTNLTPAHIDNHGSLASYIAAKAKLFTATVSSPLKQSKKQKLLGVCLDGENLDSFLGFHGKNNVKMFATTLEGKTSAQVDTIYAANKVASPRAAFILDGETFGTKILGDYNAYNALLATATCLSLSISTEDCKTALASFAGAPGRMEQIPNSRGITIIVDYACTPIAFKTALPSVRAGASGKLIHVFGMTGGLRDASQRFIQGKISAQYSDAIIITNEDAYESDLAEIMENIETGTTQAEHPRATVVEKIGDRKAAIARAIELAQVGDTVFITGKGCEQFHILPGNVKIPWDDRNVVRDILNNFSQNSRP